MTSLSWADYRWLIMQNPPHTRVWLSHGHITLEVAEPRTFDEKLEAAQSLADYLNAAGDPRWARWAKIPSDDAT